MALFSDKLSLDEKSRLAARILTLQSSKPAHWDKVEIGQHEVRYQLGKPVLYLDLSTSTSLPDLVGPQSFLLFDLLVLPWDWLGDNPDTWEQSDSYMQMRDNVRTVNVINDVAERCVKLIADYATILTTEDKMRSLLLHGVERIRKMFPNFKKSVLNR